MAMNPDTSTIKAAQDKLDAHVREIVQWHFSPETGSPFWLEWAKKAGWNPATEVKGFADLLRFPHFQDEWLRDLPNEVWVPKKYQGWPFNIFETGGTTGMPKQRIGWDDYKVDYSEFSEKLSDEHFPRNHYWLMVGPTGPRRLRLSVEHLANVRGSSCYFVDLDPRWVKKVIGNKQFDQARAYMDHVVDQAVMILKHRKISGMFTTPKLLEALGEKVNLWDAGIRGVFCGGTTMAPQYVRFIVEEVLENRIGFYPTYGNTLMGLAASVPLRPEDNFSITYYAPQPRAVLRIVEPNDTLKVKNYGEWGRVELTTLTKEFFMPRFLERDEAIRREPRAPYAWDGVAEVRPFGAMEKNIVEGVY
jgi:phenylacetate-coenzyme A ligase PaaK-like adenylate-forming protein